MIDLKFSDELNAITASLKAGNDAVSEFEEFLTEICSLPEQSFSTNKWPEGWRKSVYEFGLSFSNNDAGPYILVLKKHLVAESEIAAFIYSEVIWNYFNHDGDYNRDQLHDLIRQYPHNPEFHNTYGLFLLENKNYEKAIFEFQRAINIDSKSFNFLSSYYTSIKAYFGYLIEKRKLDLAEKQLNESLEYLKTKNVVNTPIGDQIRLGILSLKDRLQDHRTIASQIDYFRKEIENTVRVEQRRLIEVLGLFSAILAFILTNLTIGISNLSIFNMLLLMLGMALVLLIFAISISYLFGPKLRYPPKLYFLKRTKFWSIILLFALLGALLFISR